MRGEERRQRAMLMIMEPGDRVPKEHPLRRVKELAAAALAQLSPLFDEMYSAIGRPSIPPERLLKSSLLMALYSARSERLFCEQLDYNCCSAGSSIWMRPSRASTTRAFRATARGCWSTTWRASFSPAWSRRPAVCNCFRTNTSPWTARRSRPGRLCSANIPPQSRSASAEAVLVVKSVENGARDNMGGRSQRWRWRCMGMGKFGGGSGMRGPREECARPRL